MPHTTLKSTWIARCPSCKAHRRIEAGRVVLSQNGKPVIRCKCTRPEGKPPSWGRLMIIRRLKGTTTDHQCNARCEASKGHVCECSCGGLNHGIAA